MSEKSYILYEKVSENRYQIKIFAQRTFVFSMDFLFEKAAALDLENLLAPDGGSWTELEEFLDALRKENWASYFFLLELKDYHRHIKSLGKAESLYLLFEQRGFRFPDGERERSLRDRFLNI